MLRICLRVPILDRFLDLSAKRDRILSLISRNNDMLKDRRKIRRDGYIRIKLSVFLFALIIAVPLERYMGMAAFSFL